MGVDRGTGGKKTTRRLVQTPGTLGCEVRSVGETSVPHPLRLRRSSREERLRPGVYRPGSTVPTDYQHSVDRVSTRVVLRLRPSHTPSLEGKVGVHVLPTSRLVHPSVFHLSGPPTEVECRVIPRPSPVHPLSRPPSDTS